MLHHLYDLLDDLVKQDIVSGSLILFFKQTELRSHLSKLTKGGLLTGKNSDLTKIKLVEFKLVNGFVCMKDQLHNNETNWSY